MGVRFSWEYDAPVCEEGKRGLFPRWWTVEKWETDLLLVLIINHNYSLIGVFYRKIF